MTTIAWDGKTLAGDTLASRGGLRNFITSKVFRIEAPCGVHLFGGAGEHESVIAVRDWIKGGMGQTKPILEKESLTGILITPDGTAHRLEPRLIPLEIAEAFHAIGAGRDFAMAAMHLGCEASKAIEVAKVFDLYTGGDVTSVTL